MLRPYRVLLIEDSPTQAGLFRGLFEDEGWEVVCAISAEAALNELNRARPDLMVVDYYLPGMNGGEFCREVRMNVNTRGIPILMLTVEGTGDAERRGLESGADDYLAKSVDPDILLLRTRALLRKSEGPAAVLNRAENFLSRAKLLAIDDSPTYLHYLAHELTTESYAVEKASGGKEALERIRKEPFDCVLVDLEMPGMSGIEVCRQIAEMRRSGENPVVVLMLTAHEEKEHMTRGLEAGADDFIGKSTDMAVLKARIRALLRRKFLMEENRRILEEKLEGIGMLAGGIAHDFNNILTEIIGTASLIKDDLPPATAGLVQNILNGAERAANLTRQLLAYAGKGRFVIQRVDLTAVVRKMKGLIRLSIPRNVEIQYILQDGLPPISADPGQMEQVLLNLVLNAGEAIEPGKAGLVSISTAIESAAGPAVAPGRYVRLEVADTGCGMDEQTKARVFDPFFTTKFTGRGLGLAAVSGIVRSQKGTVIIHTAPRRGTTFRVLFPAGGS